MTTIGPETLTVTIAFGDGRPRTGVVVVGPMRYPFMGMIGLLQVIETLCGVGEPELLSDERQKIVD